MLTVIFGAGASYDSAPLGSSEIAIKNEWRPPLTMDLFNANRPWFKDAFPIQPDLLPVLTRIRRESTKMGLEKTLENLKLEMHENSKRWRQILAIQEFISRVLNECMNNWLPGLNDATTYVDLISRIGDWNNNKNDINLISFNYDTMLEKAVGLYYGDISPWKDFDKYLFNDLKIFKPHGSTNWHTTFRHNRGRDNILTRPLTKNEQGTVSLRFIINNWLGIQTYKRDSEIYSSVPAIAIPVVSKSSSDFLFPPGHQEKMIANLKSTSAILVMGWAAAEEHFLSLLNQYVSHDVPVLVVCKDGGRDVIMSLTHKGGLENCFNTSQGISNFLNTNQLEDWLNGLPNS